MMMANSIFSGSKFQFQNKHSSLMKDIGLKSTLQILHRPHVSKQSQFLRPKLSDPLWPSVLITWGCSRQLPQRLRQGCVAGDSLLFSMWKYRGQASSKEAHSCAFLDDSGNNRPRKNTEAQICTSCKPPQKLTVELLIWTINICFWRGWHDSRHRSKNWTERNPYLCFHHGR